MAHEFKLKRRVEFADTDMAGIAHFSNFFRWMEATEHAFFRSLGFTLHENDSDGMHGWTRVHADCDYKRPLRYPDEFEVRLLVRGKCESSIEYAFAFMQADSEVELGEIQDRLRAANQQTFDQPEAECCYAKSTKTWVRDPDQLAWETFVTHGQITHYGADVASESKESRCCA